jgi:hypothetical protein
MMYLHDEVWSKSTDTSNANARLGRAIRSTNTYQNRSVFVLDGVESRKEGDIAIHPKIIAAAIPAYKSPHQHSRPPLGFESSRKAKYGILTIPKKGANLGASSDSAMMKRSGLERAQRSRATWELTLEA